MASITFNLFPLLAVDVGNSRLKLGHFERAATVALPHPDRALALGLEWTDEELLALLPHAPDAYQWAIASVNRPAASRLVAWLEARGVTRIQVLTHVDLPLSIALPRPEGVGLDRLCNAVAANTLRGAGEPAIVIDLGTAITVDLINEHGAFAGGAIMPGLATAARALHEFTDLLPQVEALEPPQPLGTSTLGAMQSGLFWGAVGAVRELITRLDAGLREPRIFITGGGAPSFANILTEGATRPSQFVPHLTLAGIALATVAARSAKEVP